MTTPHIVDSGQAQVVKRLAELLERVTRGRVGGASQAACTPLRELDIDSASLLAFLVAIEESFHIEWDEDLPDGVLATLDSIAAYVTSVSDDPAQAQP